jgi:hypothetical protein
MNWETVAKERLKEYSSRTTAIRNIEEQLKTLESTYTTIRSAKTDGVAVSDNTNRRESMLISNIATRDELKRNLEVTKTEIEITEKGLKCLTDEEKRILTLFYINRCNDYITRLCDELFISKSELYRRKDEALKKFTRACYGIVEL